MKRRETLFLALFALIPGVIVFAYLRARQPDMPERYVTVYCALDRLHAEPILKVFAERTGIWVRPKWDTEATKTTGLVAALRAEADRPRCDVFWNNEVSHSIALGNDGLLEPYRSPAAEGLPAWARDPEGLWTGFAARARVIIFNTDQVKPTELPTQLEHLTHPHFKGRVGIAKPLFGTTATHVAAMWAEDPEATKAWLEKLKANAVVVCAGNADVKDRVAQGELAVGLTDTDDANLAIQARKPVGIVFPDQAEGKPGTLLIPNSVAIMKGAPHVEDAKLLVDYLLSAEVEEALAKSRSAQIPLRADLPRVGLAPSDLRASEVDWAKVAAALEASRDYLETVFLR